MRVIPGLKPGAGKTVICLAALLVLGFSPISNSFSAAAESDGSNTGLPDHIILSWTENPRTTLTIAWRTGTGTTQSTVQYLPAAGFSGDFEEAEEAKGVRTDFYDGYYHFEATLRGLVPGISYVYRVGWEGAWSEPFTFTTAAGDGQFSFLYMGDIQEGYDSWGEMVKKAYKDHPDLKFGLLGGDLVNQGNSIEEWQQFFAAASPVFNRIPLMPAAGNHDDGNLFWNSFALPRNGPDGYEEKFYSFNYGNCHITVLNSNYMGVPGVGDYDKLAGWLQDDLNNSDRQWKLVVMHHPPYPVVQDWRAEHLQTNWVPFFEQCGVDMVLVGHQHVYMRTGPLRDGAVRAEGEGVVYIMGNAGAKYYGPGPDHDYIARQIAHVSNYQLINVDGSSLTLTAKDAGGNTIDSYRLIKQPVIRKSAYSIIPVDDTAYRIGTNGDGIKTMTVSDGVFGMKYFSVQVVPVSARKGSETIVFTHSRDGILLSINALKANFDSVDSVRAGFNVQPGDVIGVYMVDELTDAADRSSAILQ